MVTQKRILIADFDRDLAAIRERLRADSGWGSVVAESSARARELLVGDETGDGCNALLGTATAAPDGISPMDLAAEFGCPFILAVRGVPVAADYRLALQRGAAGVLGNSATALELEAVLATAATRSQEALGQREELRRHAYRSAEMRQKCADQAKRYQSSQDTFYLDLSRLMTIITNIMDGIVFVDRAGNVTLLNPAAEDLLGTKSFVVIGKPIRTLQGRAELVAALSHDHDHLQSQQAVPQKEITQTVEVHHSEHDLVYIKCITSSVMDYHGRPAGVLTVLKNVTAEFKTDQLKNQYLSIVAHELRTPLTGIKTFSTMMAKGKLGEMSERQHVACESIREQSLRLEHQIDKLINLGSLESADYGQDRKVVSVADFATGLLLPFEQPTRDRGISLSLTVEDFERPLLVDRADLRRACQALIENAVKFTPDGGRVEVFISRSENGEPRFRVLDHGIGIDPRYLRRIFEKFFQVEDPLTRHHGGAGLGLFVARGIVEVHGSRIEVSSQLGQGADFSFVLPVHDPAAETAAQTTASGDVLV